MTRQSETSEEEGPLGIVPSVSQPKKTNKKPSAKLGNYSFTESESDDDFIGDEAGTAAREFRQHTQTSSLNVSVSDDSLRDEDYAIPRCSEDDDDDDNDDVTMMKAKMMMCKAN